MLAGNVASFASSEEEQNPDFGHSHCQMPVELDDVYHDRLRFAAFTVLRGRDRSSTVRRGTRIIRRRTRPKRPRRHRQHSSASWSSRFQRRRPSRRTPSSSPGSGCPPANAHAITYKWTTRALSITPTSCRRRPSQGQHRARQARRSDQEDRAALTPEQRRAKEAEEERLRQAQRVRRGDRAQAPPAADLHDRAHRPAATGNRALGNDPGAGASRHRPTRDYLRSGRGIPASASPRSATSPCQLSASDEYLRRSSNKFRPHPRNRREIAVTQTRDDVDKTRSTASRR